MMFLTQIILVVKVKSCFEDSQEEHCFKSQREFDKWLITPCIDNWYNKNLTAAITQMKIFKTKLDQRMECMNIRPEVTKF